MKTIDLHQVDSFTNTIFGGNPAGVVTNANELTDDEMIKIAREMNLSETAFVQKPTTDSADVKLRFFTPAAAEIDFCGHATVGALYELSRLNMYGLGKQGENNVRVETNAGILDMSVTTSNASQPQITFAAPRVDMEPYQLQGQAFTNNFGVALDALRTNANILIDRKLSYLYIPINSLKQLGSLKFDFDKIRANFAAENIIAFCLFTNETFDKKAELHARVTCPLVGIDEDPFTGSTQSGLIHAAKQIGIIDEAQTSIVTEQGNFMGRGGLAQITHNIVTDELLVTASAAQVFSTKVEF